jgi:hypothetical protein
VAKGTSYAGYFGSGKASDEGWRERTTRYVTEQTEEADAASGKSDKLRRIFWFWQGKRRGMEGAYYTVRDRTDRGSGRRQNQNRQVGGGGELLLGIVAADIFWGRFGKHS